MEWEEITHVIYRMATMIRHGDQKADQEDLAQEMLAKLWRCKQRGKIPPHVLTNRAIFDSWCQRVMRNLAIDRYRRWRSRCSQELLYADWLYGVFPDSGQDRQENELYDGELPVLLRQIIMALIPGHRKMILLRLQGCTYEEIAERTGHTLGRTKSKLHQIRQNMRKRLARHYLEVS